MSNEWNPDAEVERLEKLRERVRQLRAKVKYLNDDLPGSRDEAENRERSAGTESGRSGGAPAKPRV